MNKKFKKRWVNALRSGKYQQGNAALRVGNKFCCLGVACHISSQVKLYDHKGLLYDEDEVGYVFQNDTGNPNFSYLPEGFRDKLGLTEYAEKALANLNDDGKSFAFIADYIEREL